MVIGKFREESEHAGKSLTYEGGAYRIDDATAVTLLQVRESDSRAELEWIDDRTRAHHLGLADEGAPAAAATAPLAGGGGYRPTGEQIRIVLYIAAGIFVALTMFVFAPSKNDEQPTNQAAGWVKVLSLSGSVSVTSETLQIRGGEQRVNWTGTPLDSGVDAQVTFRLVPAEPVSGSSAPVPAGGGALRGGAKSDGSAVLAAPPGSYRLEVEAVNCEWSVSVWDKE